MAFDDALIVADEHTAGVVRVARPSGSSELHGHIKEAGVAVIGAAAEGGRGGDVEVVGCQDGGGRPGKDPVGRGDIGQGDQGAGVGRDHKDTGGIRPGVQSGERCRGQHRHLAGWEDHRGAGQSIDERNLRGSAVVGDERARTPASSARDSPASGTRTPGRLVENFQEGIRAIGEITRAGVPELEVVVQPHFIIGRGWVDRPLVRVENESEAVGIRGIPPNAPHPQVDRVFLQTWHVFHAHGGDGVGSAGAPAQGKDTDGRPPGNEVEGRTITDHGRLVIHIKVVIDIRRDLLQVDGRVIGRDRVGTVDARRIVAHPVKPLTEKGGGVGVGDGDNQAVEPGPLVAVGGRIHVEALEPAARKIEAGRMRCGQEP